MTEQAGAGVVADTWSRSGAENRKVLDRGAALGFKGSSREASNPAGAA